MYVPPLAFENAPLLRTLKPFDSKSNSQVVVEFSASEVSGRSQAFVVFDGDLDVSYTYQVAVLSVLFTIIHLGLHPV